MIPQLSNFISDFHTTISQSNVNVITDASGNMSIDVPGNMSDAQAQKVTTRIGILDRLIQTQSTNITDLLNKGFAIEDKIKINNPDSISEMLKQKSLFTDALSAYKH
uniref:hypothetical protein n=1 Tax=Pseudofabraea citricarpa TaxID=1664388 RepID=UPI0022FD4677|nr:hypothetical protein PN052_mgp18 [Pseudofabraea citricarpa]WAX38809.1 hypothetical protein [Pseudofabraea citricarpa]